MKSLLLACSFLFPVTCLTVIERDIAIIGGGATGTYAAVRLHDLNQSVVIVEKNNRLGGHTHTYYDPTTKVPVNFGVQFYHDDSVVRSFFDRLGVPLTPGLSSGTLKSLRVDLSRSLVAENQTVPPIGQDYIDHLGKYPYLENGFHLPSPVPEDLLLPWAKYIEKYNLDDSALASLQGPNPAGSPLQRLVLYQFNFVNDIVLSQLAGHLVSSANRDNTELYSKAFSAIGAQNFLLSSTVSHGRRSSSGVELIVSTPRGDVVVRAKQLIVAAPPNAKNMASIGLDARESQTLSQIGGYPFYSGVIKDTGLPSGFDFKNMAAENKFDVPSLPFTVHIVDSGTVPGVFIYTYSAISPLTQVQVQANVRKDIKRLQAALKSQGANITEASPKFLAFSDDSPFHSEQSAESVKNGFYDEMYRLQGYRNTWYISALFVLNAAQLWNNTAALLPDIVSAAAATQ